MCYRQCNDQPRTAFSPPHWRYTGIMGLDVAGCSAVVSTDSSPDLDILVRGIYVKPSFLVSICREIALIG